MKSITTFLLLSLMILAARTAAAYEIVLPEDPHPWDKTAAAELERFLKKTVSSFTIGGKEAVFYVGDTAFARKNGVSPDKMEPEAWQIRSFGNGCVIVGGGNRGTLYGVYSFIEKILGVRFFSPSDEYIPEIRKTAAYEKLDFSGKPFFNIRYIYRMPHAEDGGRFAAKSRLNIDRREADGIAAEFGGGVKYGSPALSHPFDHENGYLPWKQYKDSHPEYFALIDGKREGRNQYGQPCLSHPEVLNIVLGKLKEYIESDEKKAKENGEIAPSCYAMGLNDNIRFCECRNCRELAEKYGTAGAYALFINKVAAFLKEFRPTYQIVVPAYFQTAAPPEAFPYADNVTVYLMNTHPLCHENLLEPGNAAFREKIKKWSEKVSRLNIRDYETFISDSMGLPVPSEFTFAPNIKYYSMNKIDGVFYEFGLYDMVDMYDLKFYMVSCLLDNPSADPEKLMREFCDGVYGKASGPIMAYRKALRDAAYRNHAVMVGFSPGVMSAKYIHWDDLKAMQSILEKAEKAVEGDPALLYKVKRVRQNLDILLVKPQLYHFYLIQAESAGERDVFNKMSGDAAKRFFSVVGETRHRMVQDEQRRIHPVSELYVKELQAGIAHRSKYGNGIPDQFKGKKVIVFPPYVWSLKDWQMLRTQPLPLPNPDAFFGYSYRLKTVPGNAKYLSGNQLFGIFRPSDKKITAANTLRKNQMSEKNIFRKILTYRTPVQREKSQVLFCTNAWLMQFDMLDALCDLYPDTEIEIYVETGFHGKAYGIGNADESYIDFGAIAVVIPEKKKQDFPQ